MKTINLHSSPFTAIFSGILKELKLQNIRNKYEAEEQAAHQHYAVSEFIK